MAYDDVYQKAIDKMIADTNAKMDEAVGWTKPPAPQVATVEAMKRYAMTVDRWNPIYYDETYAAGTRWGGLVAYPMFSNSLRGNDVATVETPECGLDYQLWIGQNWNFYQPIRPGDTFKVWNRRPQLMEKTKPGVKGPRVFAILEGDCDHINQHDELVSTRQQICYRTFYEGGTPPPDKMPHYQYTERELEYIDSCVRAEEIRGANIRYWEDVNIGDETKPTVLGPTNMSDNAVGGGMFMMPTTPRELLHEGAMRFNDFVQDPATGLWESNGGPAGRHWSDLEAQRQGEPCAFLFCVLSIYTILRGISNWMGDDGFLRKFNWRHVMRTPVGDCNITHGRVTNKRVENGDYLVDLKVWLRNMRGIITEVSNVTIQLVSKNEPYPPIKK